MATREVIVELRLGDTQAVKELGRMEAEVTRTRRALAEQKKELIALDKAVRSGAITQDEYAEANKRAEFTLGRLRSEAKNLSSGINELSNDTAGLTAAGTRFRDKMAAATLEAIKQSGVIGKLDAQYATLKQAFDANVATIQKNELGMRELQQQYKRAELSAKEYREAKLALKKETLAIIEANGKLDVELKKVGGQISVLDKRVEDLTADLRAGRISVEEFKRGVDSINKEVSKQGTLLTQGISDVKSYITGMIGVTAAITVFRDITNTVIEFDQAQGNLAAILGTNKAGIAALTEEAKRYGAATTFTAAQVTELQTELAKLGFTQEQVKAATPAVLSLAEATGTSLANAATIAAQTLNAFGLSALETQRVVDVIAQSANLSAFDIDTFSAAMSNAAPAAKAVGVEIEEASAMLSALVDAGIPAEKAGTDLRNIFISLAEKGITMDEAFAQIRGSTDKLTTSVGLFDARAAGSALILVDNTEKVKRLEEGYLSAAGAAEEMARVQRDTLQGSIKQLQSAWEGFILSIEDGSGIIGEAATFMIGRFTDLLNALTRIGTADGFFNTVDAIADSFEKLGGIGIVVEKWRDWLGLDIDQDAQAAINSLSGVKRAAAELVEATKSGDRERIASAQEAFNKERALEMERIKAAAMQVNLKASTVEQTTVEEAAADATDKRTASVKKLTEAQKAQLDIEAQLRADASANIFGVTPGAIVPVGQAEEKVTPDEAVAANFAKLTELRQAFFESELTGLRDFNMERALLEAEYLNGSIASKEEYLRRAQAINDAEVNSEAMKLQALANVSGALAALFGEQSAEAKAAATVQALINTYLGATQALSDKTIPNTFARIAAMASVVIAGLAQVKKIQGFEEGGYTPRRASDHEPVSFVHANEWVAPAWQTRHPVYGPYIRWMEQGRRRRGMPTSTDGFFRGGIVRGTALVNMPTGPTMPAGAIASADLSRAIMNMPPPVVSVQEIRDVQGRVNAVERISRL